MIINSWLPVEKSSSIEKVINILISIFQLSGSIAIETSVNPGGNIATELPTQRLDNLLLTSAQPDAEIAVAVHRRLALRSARLSLDRGVLLPGFVLTAAAVAHQRVQFTQKWFHLSLSDGGGGGGGGCHDVLMCFTDLFPQTTDVLYRTMQQLYIPATQTALAHVLNQFCPISNANRLQLSNNRRHLGLNSAIISIQSVDHFNLTRLQTLLLNRLIFISYYWCFMLFMLLYLIFVIKSTLLFNKLIIISNNCNILCYLSYYSLFLL